MVLLAASMVEALDRRLLSAAPTSVTGVQSEHDGNSCTKHAGSKAFKASVFKPVQATRGGKFQILIDGEMTLADAYP